MSEQQDVGTLGGNPITQEMLDSYAVTFERDWASSETEIVPTERGKILRALNDLNIPSYEIEALEKRARHNEQSLGVFIHTILQNELLVVNE